MVDIEVTGLDSLARLSRAMREAGGQGKGLKRELRTGLNRETKVTRANMRKAIAPALPKSGGLAADVARSTRFTTRIGTGSSVSVQIKARGKRSIRRMNATGTWRHPVFGRRDTWVNQYDRRLPGFLDKPFEASRPQLQYGVAQAIARIQANIYRSI
jgi:hypothetical protein